MRLDDGAGSSATGSPPRQNTYNESSAFKRYNALFDHGWLAVLTPIEVKVWLAYAKHANPEGYARPGVSLIATKLGTRPNHVRSARASLEKRGLLERLNNRGGATSCEVRLLTPPTITLPGSRVGCAEEDAPTRLAGGDAPPTRIRDATLPGFGTLPLPESRTQTLPEIGTQNRVLEQTHEQTIEHTHGAPVPELIAGKARNPKPQSPNDEIAARIYDAYPKKVARGEALAAIKKAIERVKRSGPPESAEDPAQWLLGQTQRYRDVRMHDPTPETMQFTPYPATWFNQERYSDDPEVWVPKQGGLRNGKPQSRNHRGIEENLPV